VRKITSHIVPGDPASESSSLWAVDGAGHGGANHAYSVIKYGKRGGEIATVSFQNGPVKEAGVNGITDAQLLAILIDRMKGFQSGPFSSRENALTITKLEEAQLWMQARTMDRMRRGVEGESKA
jgi:hypothetical protein